MGNEGNRHITPEKAKEILEQNNLKINRLEAALLLDFLYKIAILSLEQVKQKKS